MIIFLFCRTGEDKMNKSKKNQNKNAHKKNDTNLKREISPNNDKSIKHFKNDSNESCQ